MESLLEKVKNANTKRNRLVHGTWQIFIKLGENGNNTSLWQRLYRPAEPEVYGQLAGKDKNQKLLDKHIYSVERIVELSQANNDLAAEIKIFFEAMSLKDFLNPQPVESFSKFDESQE